MPVAFICLLSLVRTLVLGRQIATFILEVSKDVRKYWAYVGLKGL